jgi:predicted PurR-regulated permease PerM
MRNHPTSFQVRTLWNAATGVSILVLGLLLVGLIWLVGQIFGYLQPVLIPVIVAGIVAYLLDPVVRRLQKWGMSRLNSVITVFIAILVSLLLLLLAILPGVNQARKMAAAAFAPNAISTSDTNPSDPTQPKSTNAATASPSSSKAPNSTDAAEEKSLSDSINQFAEGHSIDNRSNIVGWALTMVDDTSKEVTPLTKERPYVFLESRLGRTFVTYKDKIMSIASSGTNMILGFVGLSIGLAMVPIYLFFFLKDSDSIQKHWHDYVPLKASRFKSELIDTLHEINGYLISFFRGQVLVGFIDGILVGIALTFYGLPYGFLIGIFMAILGIIPYVGNIICLIPACMIAWFHAKTSTPFGLEPVPYMLGVVAIFVVVQQINSLATAPKIVGDSVGLHPMTVIFSMLFWSVILGGFVGALLAVPLTAAVKVLFRRYIWEKKIMDLPVAETSDAS